MNEKNKVEIEVQAKGFKEAAEDVELLADAVSAFPSTINIKASECKINIHNTNWIEQKQPEPRYAKGGVINKIVHCGECKKAFDVEGEIICNHLSGMVGLNVVVKADDFCSYGERKDNE